MHASLFLISSYLCRLSSLTAASPLVDSACGHLYGAIISSFPFQFTYLFTTHLNVGSPSQPINITGGVLIDEPTPNGTASGPAINGMIKDGLAYPQILENGTLQVPSIVLYGNADDETPFSISELGIGNPSAQVTRIVCPIVDELLDWCTSRLIEFCSNSISVAEISTRRYVTTTF